MERDESSEPQPSEPAEDAELSDGELDEVAGGHPPLPTPATPGMGPEWQ